jgi:hypothetical protein
MHIQLPPLPEATDLWLTKKPPHVAPMYLAARMRMYQLLPGISEVWKYSQPFFQYQGLLFGYLNYHNTEKRFYLGIYHGRSIHHPALHAFDYVQRYYLDAKGAIDSDEFAEILFLAASDIEKRVLEKKRK